jgi:hypothetical protein
MYLARSFEDAFAIPAIDLNSFNSSTAFASPIPLMEETVLTMIALTFDELLPEGAATALEFGFTGLPC